MQGLHASKKEWNRRTQQPGIPMILQSFIYMGCLIVPVVVIWTYKSYYP